MQSIVDALKKGNAKERLAVVADLLSVLGISLATVVGGAFALNANLDVENILGTLIGGLLILAGAAVVISLFIASSNWLSKALQNNPPVQGLIQLALWLSFSALFVYASYFVYVVFSSMRFIKA